MKYLTYNEIPDKSQVFYHYTEKKKIKTLYINSKYLNKKLGKVDRYDLPKI